MMMSPTADHEKNWCFAFLDERREAGQNVNSQVLSHYVLDQKIRPNLLDFSFFTLSAFRDPIRPTTDQPTDHGRDDEKHNNRNVPARNPPPPRLCRSSRFSPEVKVGQQCSQLRRWWSRRYVVSTRRNFPWGASLWSTEVRALFFLQEPIHDTRTRYNTGLSAHTSSMSLEIAYLRSQLTQSTFDSGPTSSRRVFGRHRPPLRPGEGQTADRRR